MHERQYKKKQLKLQTDNGTETRLNQFNSAKKPQNSASSPHSKLSKEQNFFINIPKPKRAYKQNQQELKLKGLQIRKQQIAHIVQGLDIAQTKPKKEAKKSKKIQPKIMNASIKLIDSKDEVIANNNSQQKKLYRPLKKDKIGQILSFYLSQSEIDRGDKLEQPMKTVYEWQNQEIRRFVDDPNIGDYIIKLPNPDNLSKDYLKWFPQAKQDDIKCVINFKNALQCYRDMFQVEDKNKRKYQLEKKSFTIAYYLMELDQSLRRVKTYLIENHDSYEFNGNKKQTLQNYFQFVDQEISVFKIVFKYYIQIDSLTLDEFRLIRKILMQNLLEAFQIYRDMTKPSLSLNMKQLAEQYQKRVFLKEQDFAFHKRVVYQKFLVSYLTKVFKYINGSPIQMPIRPQSLGYGKDFFDDSEIEKAKHQYYCLSLIKSLQKTSTLFTYFMSTIDKQIYTFIEHQLSTNNSERKIFKGRNLQKVAMGQNLMWMNNKAKPQDLYTLLRNCLIYQLTQNCLLRTRSFITKNEENIMLVVKVSQDVLQYYAQKNEIFMQLEIGATDIFSFEPVDKYQRPLRLNSYIRDEEFINKYSLKQNKMDKDSQTDIKSTQSQAFNLYKKAQNMNPDQLRAKIILDQQQTDQCYRWIRQKLNIKYIDDLNILNNEKNKDIIDRQTWECYYVYNKLIASFIKRLMKVMDAQSQSVQNDEYLNEINNNIGFMLRIMFVKAIAMVNDFFYKNRQKRSVIPNFFHNLFISKRKLKNIWDRLDIRQPTGYTEYIKNKSLQRIWRKYQINERKDRSKFFPAQRLNICNKIIGKYINIDRAIQKRHVVSFYPLHDPFILKGIKIEPYLLSLKQKIQSQNKEKQKAQTCQKQTFNMYTLYQSKYTESDFTKLSVEQKLGINHSLYKQFSVETVRFYCGQKIAFYFEFTRYIVQQTFPWLIFAFIIQIFLWVEQTQVSTSGFTYIGYLNDALIFIMTLFNMFWTTNTVENWKFEEKNLAQKFGVVRMTEKDEKIVTFVGEYKRNFETDDMNFQYVPEYITMFKSIFTFVINILYLTLVSLVIIQIFVLKSVLFQRGFPQSVVNRVPSLMIAVVVQIFNYLYTFLIKLITQFQNHKTISSFERSLISKSYVVTFVITFISLFIYAFFSEYLDGDYMCLIRTTETREMQLLFLPRIQNCSYFVSSQLLSLVLVDLLFTIIGSIWPYLKFKIQEYLEGKKERPKTKFYFNKFQSIDEFYEQEDKMYSNMFNQIIDNSWKGYMNVISVFTALALFGPALPFVYALTFASTLVRLHASKYEIIYLAKRSIPVKTSSINYWLTVIEIVSVVSIITNIAYMIYTRKVFSSNQTQIFFFFILSFLLLKFYLLMQYNDKLDVMGQRNNRKVTDVLLKKANERISTTSQPVNTDILNVYYDELLLKRIVPKIKKANVRFKDYKKTKQTPRKQIHQ